MQTRHLILVFIASSCAPVASPPTQAIVYVDTDAIVPSHTSSTRAVLFDRLRVSVYRPGESKPCAGCTNEFNVVDEDFAEHRVSVGVPLPALQEGHRVEVQLLFSAHEGADGAIDPGRTLKTVVSLPAIPEAQTMRFTALLLTDTLGSPAGSLDEPIAALAGAPTTSRVGTWSGAERKSCTTQPDPDQVCIPGGAFWMGNPRSGAQQFGAPPVRLVVVSPFWLDRTEVTVAAHRASGQFAFAWSGSNTGAALEDYCTFTPTPGPHELLPVNCVAGNAARDHCVGRGGDLPTEAQFEWAASALGRFSFVWGEDAPTCTDATYARGGYGAFSEAAHSCMPASAQAFVLPAGATARDALVLEKDTVVDLAGNLGEWARDRWQHATESCWAGSGILHDPFCNTSSKIDLPPDPKLGPFGATRGGAWLNDARLCQASMRFKQPSLGADAGVGFRCARPGI